MTKLRAHYLFGNSNLPVEVDEGTQKILNELATIKDKEEYLKKAYDKVTRRYEGGKVETFSKFWQLWSNSIDDLINRSGFMHCTNQNFLLANILVKSGLFNPNDIKVRWTTIWYISPHQFLEINLDSKKVYVDPWARHYGISFGSYAFGFNTTTFKKFAD